MDPRDLKFWNNIQWRRHLFYFVIIIPGVFLANRTHKPITLIFLYFTYSFGFFNLIIFIFIIIFLCILAFFAKNLNLKFSSAISIAVNYVPFIYL